MAKKEQWDNIPWYKWFYIASTFWNIRSLDRFINHWQWWKSFKRWKILNPTKRNTWYCFVELVKEWKGSPFWVHRLIAATFLWLDLNNKELYACHKNDKRCDNRVSNLFVWTAQDNNSDMMKKWRHNYWKETAHKKWSNHKYAILTEEDVLEIRKLYKEWCTQKSLAEKFNTDWSNISMIVNRKRWTHI